MTNHELVSLKLPINKTIEQALGFFTKNFKAIMSFYPQYFLLYCGAFYGFSLISYLCDLGGFTGNTFTLLSYLSIVISFPLATAFIIGKLVASTNITLSPQFWSPLNNIKIYMGYTLGFITIIFCQIGLGYIVGLILASPVTGVNHNLVKFGIMLMISIYGIFKLNSKMLAYPIKVEHSNLKFRQLLKISATVVSGNEWRFFLIIMLLIAPINIAVDRMIDKLISSLGFTGENLFLFTVFTTSVTGFFSVVFFSILLGTTYQYFKPKIETSCLSSN